MGIQIDLNNLNVDGNASVMECVKIRDNNDVYIAIKDSDIKENAKILNNLEIDSIWNELQMQARTMDKNSLEYPKIKEILGVKQWKTSDFRACASKHIKEFSQGVLASIVANYIYK